LAEKNTNNNQKSNKKHRWIGIFLIALLLLFIGLAGYYLERDLEPVPENQIEQQEEIGQNDAGPEREEATTEQLTDKEDKSKERSDMTDREDISESVESELEKDKTDKTIEKEQTTEQTDETEQADETESIDQKDQKDQKDVEQADNKSETEETSTSGDLDSEAESDIQVNKEIKDKKDVTDAESAGEDLKSSEAEDIKQPDSSKSELEDSNSTKVTQDQPVSDSAEKETETKTEQLEKDSAVKETKTKTDIEKELEDPSLIERILSILGLAESDFTQNLNILFVGLDDEESVSIGSIEADSIMVAKLRPENNKLQIEHIDEDTVYKGELLREYHDGDIQPAVEEISGNKIDYYVYVNYLGFEKVIDELGGVSITLDQEVKVPGLGLNLKAGDNLLSGKEALNFVRWRSSDSLERFERQKLLINSVMAKLKSNNILFNVKELYNTIVESYNSIETDINPVLAAEIFNYIRENKELELEYID
jgi:LCP family protein required for cell wall assembly